MSADLGYSEEELTADLQIWWDEQVSDSDDPFAEPSGPRTGTIFEVVPMVDSLAVVTALITIENHVKFEIPPQIIRAGGYGDFPRMIADLLPKVRALVLKKHKKEAA